MKCQTACPVQEQCEYCLGEGTVPEEKQMNEQKPTPSELVRNISDLAVAYVQNGGTRKVADAPIPCAAPDHHPPSHQVFEPGVYEHVCGVCGRKTTFNVSRSMA